MSVSATTSLLGIVAIGRNEGERLKRCLESVVGRGDHVVYVDSGSTDDSVKMARGMGVEVVELDTSVPFTAARARNAGIARLLELAPDIEYVQVVDGDCEFVDGWFDAALETMNADPKTAVVCGRRRERDPDATVYHRLCDMEWNSEVGPAKACGGDALIRVEAYGDVGGYNPALIAGEEPEMCFRMRQQGWKVNRIDHDMVLHDIQMDRFGQWWRRCVRSGWAFAEGAAMHGDSPERYKVHDTLSIWFWGFVLPVGALAIAWPTKGLSLLLLAAYPLLMLRVKRRREGRGDTPDDARIYAFFCVLSKFPQFVGIVKFQINRLLGRRARLIEYKGAAAEVRYE